MIFEGCLAGSLFSFALLERICNASGYLVYRLMFGATDGGVKGYASVQLIGSGATYLASLWSWLAQMLCSTAVGLLSYTLWAAALMACFSLLYVLQEYYPEVLIEWAQYWNGTLGPVVVSTFLAPLRVADVVFSAVVPIYNFVVWTGSQLFYSTIVSNAVSNIATYADLGVSVAATASRSAVSASNYVQTFASPCPTPVTDSCYDPGQRMLDLITPMSGLRLVAGNLTR